jgi:hypothetical protein
VLQKILSSSKPSLFENCIVAKQARMAHLLFDKNIFTAIICLILMNLKFFATLPPKQAWRAAIISREFSHTIQASLCRLLEETQSMIS